MSVMMKIVPVRGFDLAWHERAIANAGASPIEHDGEVWPTPAEHRADRRAIAAVRRTLDKLTPAQRRASRTPTRTELWEALDAAARAIGCVLQITRPSGSPTWSASLEVREGAKIVEDLQLFASEDSFYCQAHPRLLHVLASEIAKLAGPQVTFLAEDYSPADVTKVFVSTTKKRKVRA